MSDHTLSEMYKLWSEFADTPINSQEEIEQPFFHFEPGTHREEIWHWFEEQNPIFIVGEVMQGIMREDPPAQGKPAVGQRWIGQGGYYGGVLLGRDSQFYYLIVAPHESDVDAFQWGDDNREVTNATSQWNGAENTSSLLKTPSAHPAAEFAASYNCEGHDDYHLGSLVEMRLLRVNAPQLFKREDYWTSTQAPDLSAAFQSFDSKVEGYINKTDKRRVRPVRWIPVS